MDIIKEYVDNEFEKAVKHRIYIHENPELSFKEYKTTKYIEDCLIEWGVEYKKLLCGTGLIASISVPNSKKTIAFRTDIDALPIEEQSGVSFSSVNDGVMHACGHDIHTATMLGFVHILSQHRELITQNLKFVFQPGEELFPGGAKSVLKEGWLKDVDCIYGFHVKPLLKYNQVSVLKGTAKSGSMVYKIKINGKGGHGSEPSKTNDPVVAACAVVTALQTICSRRTDPRDSVVVSTCMIHGGTKGNIIPDYVNLEGQIRAFSKELLTSTLKNIKEIATGVCKGYGCEASVTFEEGYAALKNWDENVDIVKEAFKKSTDCSEEYFGPDMASEDFAYYLEQIKGAYFNVGTRTTDKDEVIPLHNSKFVVDNRAIKTAMEVFLRILQIEQKV